MKGIVTFCFTLAFQAFAFCQNDTSISLNDKLPRNNISIELGGKAIGYSVGYERTFIRRNSFMLTGFINASYEPFTGYAGVVLPVGLNLLAGENKNKLLTGLSVAQSIDFNPYPQTKAQRKEYLKSGQYLHDYYSPPYSIILISPFVGYRKYLKNNNSLSITLLYHILHESTKKWNFFQPILVPWFGVNYNFKI